MSEEDKTNSSKAGLSKPSLKLNARSFKPGGSKAGLSQSSFTRPVADQSLSNSTTGTGYSGNSSFGSTQASMGASIVSGGPPIGNPTNFVPNTANGTASTPASLSQSSSTRPAAALSTEAKPFKMKATAKEFVPKFATTTPGTETGSTTVKLTTKSEGFKPPGALKPTNKTFIPKGLSQTVDPTSRPVRSSTQAEPVAAQEVSFYKIEI